MPKLTVQQPAPLLTMASVLLVTLYFRQGLPAGLSVHVLPPLLREAGVELYWLGFLKLLAQPGHHPWLLIVSGYKLGDALISPMLKPLLIDQGLGLAEVGGFPGGAALSSTWALAITAALRRAACRLHRRSHPVAVLMKHSVVSGCAPNARTPNSPCC